MNKNIEKLVPSLRFGEFVGEWEEMTLEDLFTFKNGLNSDKEKYGRGIKFINVLDIINNDFITYNKILGSVEVTEKELEKNEVVYGDILFQRSSETREEVGQANVYLDKEKSAVFGGFVIRGHRKTEYEPLFMNYLLKTQNARKEITTKSGGSTRYNVGQESLKEVKIKTTSLPEQKKIATFLSAVDKKIQQLSRKKALLETYKKGVMQQLFSGEMRFKEENGEDFEDWEVKKLGEISSSPKYGLNAAAKEFDGVNKYIRITDIDETNHKFKPSPLTSPEGEIDESYFLKEGDILFTRTGASTGKSYIYQEEDGRVAFAGFLIRFNITKCNPKFIFYQTQRYDYAKWVSIMSMRSGQPGINAKEYASFSFNLPSLPEQQKIANYLTALDKKIETISAQISKARTFKKGLLQQLFV